MTTRKLAVAALSLGVAATLAACGAAGSSHVVQGTVPPASTPTTAPVTSSTTAPQGTATTAPSGSQPSGSPSPTSADTLSTTTLNQVAAELGTLDTNLSTADDDLNNPQGDS
ncbi:MAG TPA: hypothetical protein VMB72_12745 [Acidimicrobiales bacterium]|nr:hypothetical protein [Acidimicrobiales bacterium]